MPFVMPDLIRHPVQRMFWIPAFAGMTDARQAAGYCTRNELKKAEEISRTGAALLSAAPGTAG
jgi:hypothetical protein